MDIPILLTKYFKGREWQLKGSDYKDLIFTDDLEPVTLKELEEKYILHKDELEKTEYKRLREEDYRRADLGSEKMIHALWDYVVENSTTAIDEIQSKRSAIKTKYPKPE